MEVRVLLFGPAADALGARDVRVRVEPGATCDDVRRALDQSCGPLRPFLPASRFALNSEFARPESTIAPGDEVALIGLVSGG